MMIYSYTQISQYLTCPRRYRHRYLDGWREKDTRAAMLFGRAFESALAAFFRREDSSAVLFREWSAFRQQDLRYSKYDGWDRMLQQGIQLFLSGRPHPHPPAATQSASEIPPADWRAERIRSLHRCNRRTRSA